MNTANKLTMLRFVLAVLFIALFYLDGQVYRIAAFFTFILAAVTDFFDGYIARKYNQITKLGKLTDPLADKVLVFSALILLLEKGFIWGWPIIIILSRDLMMGIFRAVAAGQKVVIAADNLGKIKTVVQLFSITLMLGGYAFNLPSVLTMGRVAFYISLVLAVVSGFNYIYSNRQILEE